MGRSVVVVLALLAGLQVSCDSGLTLPPSTPTISGFVAEVDVAAATLIVKRTGDDCGIRFDVPSGTTVLLRTRGGELQRVPFTDVPRGQFVQVWSERPSAGCPQHAVASAILIAPVYPD